MLIGVLALQGAFREHMMSLEALGVRAEAVRLPEQMDACAGLVMPGGESTAIGKLMRTYGFYEAIPRRASEGMAVWGTCAGAILMGREIIDAVEGQEPLGLMDVVLHRNAYGRQVDSFEVDLQFDGLEDDFRGVFIRAPWVESVGEGVDVLATHERHIVAAREGRNLVTTFHPELTGDPAVHRYFVSECVQG